MRYTPQVVEELTTKLNKALELHKKNGACYNLTLEVLKHYRSLKHFTLQKIAGKTVNELNDWSEDGKPLFEQEQILNIAKEARLADIYDLIRISDSFRNCTTTLDEFCKCRSGLSASLVAGIDSAIERAESNCYVSLCSKRKCDKICYTVKDCKYRRAQATKLKELQAIQIVKDRFIRGFEPELCNNIWELYDLKRDAYYARYSLGITLISQIIWGLGQDFPESPIYDKNWSVIDLSLIEKK